MKTYLFGPSQTGAPIKKATVDYKMGVNRELAPRRVQYQVTPKAIADGDLDGTSALMADISKTITTLQVQDSSVFTIGESIEIGNEVMKVKTLPDATSITVIRGQNGTNKAEHLAGAPIDLINSADDALLDAGDDFGFNELTSFYG